jgi:hypothetical protein
MSEYILMIQFDDESTKENQSAFFLQENPMPFQNGSIRFAIAYFLLYKTK